MSLSLTFNWVCNFILNLIFRFMQVRLSLQSERLCLDESLQCGCETSALKQQHWWKELKFYIQLVIYCKGKYSFFLSTQYNFSPLELYFSCPFKQKAMLGYVYLPFIVILIGAIVFIFFKVPETKNRTFDEIAATITRGRKAKAPFDDLGEEMQKMNT